MNTIISLIISITFQCTGIPLAHHEAAKTTNKAIDMAHKAILYKGCIHTYNNQICKETITHEN